MAKIIMFPGSDNESPRPDESRYPRLATTDRDVAPVLSQTIALLQAVGEREPLRATAKGNLPTAVVKELVAGAFADAEPGFARVNREDHSIVLSRVRRLAQKAGLLSYRTGAFRLTKSGRAALESDDVDGVYRRLLEAHLRAPAAVDRFDRIPVGSVVAETVPLLLFAARDNVSGWREDLEHALRRALRALRRGTLLRAPGGVPGPKRLRARSMATDAALRPCVSLARGAASPRGPTSGGRGDESHVPGSRVALPVRRHGGL